MNNKELIERLKEIGVYYNADEESVINEAATALEQADAENAELLEALLDTLDFLEHHSNRWDGANGKHPHVVAEAARAAIAKATGS